MTKILLVEDDRSLREIYGVRLLAEGYDIVTASDGEEALAIAIKEHPALIISDVMMPKISGFDMLDILKSTTETRNIRVIMMTALSSEEQRERGERIGADRYLVKSQVGIEDVVKTVHEVLGDKPASAPTQMVTPAAMPPTAQTQTTPSPAPTQTTPQTWQQPQAPQQPVAQTWPQPQSAQPTVQQQTAFTPAPQSRPIQPTPPPNYTMPPVASTTPARPATRQRIIQPISNPTEKVDINELLNRELAKEAGLSNGQIPQVSTTAQEKQLVNSQIQQAGASQTEQPTTTPVAESTSISNPFSTAPTPAVPQNSTPTQPVDRTSIGEAPVRPEITPPTR